MTYLLFISFFLFIHSQAAGPNVAIIGAGIGGGTCSYFLRKNIPSIQITAFESNNYIGGRLKHFSLNGTVYELGGDAWASPNVIMQELASELNITTIKDKADGNDIIAVWLGGHNWKTINESISYDSLTLAYEMTKFRTQLWEDYNLYNLENSPFLNVNSFFQPFDLGLEVSMKDFMVNAGISDEFLLVEVVPVIRAIYDQELEVNAFAGMVSLVPIFADSFSVEGGNSLLVEKLFEVSKTDVRLSTTVETVTKTSDGRYQIGYSEKMNGKIKNSVDVYDAVFVATPLESSLGLKFFNILPFEFPLRKYRHWYVTYTLADGLNSFFFGINPVPDHILTSTGGDSLPFVILSLRGQANGKKVYKTFSNNPINDWLDSIFVNPDPNPVVQFWPQTFPELIPTELFQQIVLDDNIYYLNAMESAATAMEASALAGKNLALLFAQRYNQTSHHVKVM